MAPKNTQVIMLPIMDQEQILFRSQDQVGALNESLLSDALTGLTGR
jgi:hypothetical protein